MTSRCRGESKGNGPGDAAFGPNAFMMIFDSLDAAIEWFECLPEPHFECCVQTDAHASRHVVIDGKSTFQSLGWIHRWLLTPVEGSAWGRTVATGHGFIHQFEPAAADPQAQGAADLNVFNLSAVA